MPEPERYQVFTFEEKLGKGYDCNCALSKYQAGCLYQGFFTEANGSDCTMGLLQLVMLEASDTCQYAQRSKTCRKINLTLCELDFTRWGQMLPPALCESQELAREILCFFFRVLLCCATVEGVCFPCVESSSQHALMVGRRKLRQSFL